MDWVLIVIILPFGYFLLRVLESIILNVVGNILTDPIKNWLANRSLLNKRKRIDQLQKELSFVTILHKDRNRLFLYVIQKGINLFGSLAITIISFIIFTTERIEPTNFVWFLLFYVITTIMVMVSYSNWNSMTTTINRIIKYDNYKKEVEKRILELSNKQSVNRNAG
jgi:hypothetical protein